MRTIRRKSLLYKSGVEYGDFCVNHVEGCSHRCLYPCYAMLLKERAGVIAGYDDWRKPKQDSREQDSREGQVLFLA